MPFSLLTFLVPPPCSGKPFHLVFIKRAIRHRFVSFFLESDDDESNEDVDEEEWEHDEKDDVEEANTHPVARLRPFSFPGRFHRLPQDTETN